MKLKPLADRVVLKQKEAEEKAESEKRRERNNRIAGAVLSGLGGLF